jgi:hypothetical protein
VRVSVFQLTPTYHNSLFSSFISQILGLSLLHHHSHRSPSSLFWIIYYNIALRTFTIMTVVETRSDLHNIWFLGTFTIVGVIALSLLCASFSPMFSETVTLCARKLAALAMIVMTLLGGTLFQQTSMRADFLIYQCNFMNYRFS